MQFPFGIHDIVDGVDKAYDLGIKIGKDIQKYRKIKDQTKEKEAVEDLKDLVGQINVLFTKLDVELKTIRKEKKIPLYYENINEFIKIYRKIKRLSKKLRILNNLTIYRKHPHLQRIITIKTGTSFIDAKSYEKEFQESFNAFHSYVKYHGKIAHRTLGYLDYYLKKNFLD